MKKDKSKERTAAYRERLAEKRETAADNITIRDRTWFFGEVIPRINARTHAEELAIHREFLRCFGAEDVQPGESLRDVARRLWSIWTRGTSHDEPDAVYCPGFNRNRQQWEFCEGFVVKNRAFDEVWTPPADDCQNGEADLPINISALPKLPPAPTRKQSEPEPKPARVPLTPAPLVTGLETPEEQQNKFQGFGTFGVSVSRTTL